MPAKASQPMPANQCQPAKSHLSQGELDPQTRKQLLTAPLHQGLLHHGLRLSGLHLSGSQIRPA
ncbi:MAG TPA: hypothetical protein DDY43_10905 [Synechococcales bacterium UBA10510]|nr:hypothetical protein [Synechococcales bacterium UBA10510]